MKPQLSVVRESDLAVVLDMMGEYYAYDHLAFDRAIARRRLKDFLGDPALGVAWLMRQDGMPVGYAFVIRGFGVEHGRNVLIDECYVRAAFRGAGWGSRVVTAALRYARRVRAESVHIQAERANRKAVAFWQRQGFHRYDRYAMVRMLSPSRHAHITGGAIAPQK